MKFSTQEEYGLRCLMAVATRGPEGSITIPEISRAENLTTAHVAKLLGILRRGGFITSTRGQAGGYTLAKPADETTVGDVLAVLGGKLYESDFCNRHSPGEGSCDRAVRCSLKPLWSQVQQAVDSVLERVTLQDLLKGDTQPLVRLEAGAQPPRRVADVG